MNADHGTPQGYWQDCRCEPCRQADREYRAESRRKQRMGRKDRTTLRYDAPDCLTIEEYYRVRGT